MKTSNIMSKYMYDLCALFKLNDCLSLFKNFIRSYCNLLK